MVELAPDVAKYVTPMASQALGDLVLAPHVLAELISIADEIRFRRELAARKIRPRSRLLFYGAPGNGKTAASAALGSMLQSNAYVVSLHEICDQMMGVTGQNLAKLFEALTDGALVVLDELDAVGAKRSGGESGSAKEFNNIVNVLLTLLDRIHDGVLVGITNRRELLDPALLRRFDFELHFDPPTEDMAEKLIVKLCERYGLPRLAVHVAEWTNYDDITKAVESVARRVAMQEIRKERKVHDADRATNGAFAQSNSEETEAAPLEGAAGG